MSGNQEFFGDVRAEGVHIGFIPALDDGEIFLRVLLRFGHAAADAVFDYVNGEDVFSGREGFVHFMLQIGCPVGSVLQQLAAGKAAGPAVFIIAPCFHAQLFGLVHAGTDAVIPFFREIFGGQTRAHMHMEAAEAHLLELLYCVCSKENMEFMREELGKSKREIKNVIFFGGGRIARKAATELADEMNIKVIEKDRHLCTLFSEKVPDALIINADGSDMDVLREEGIEDADAFVAVTESSEANIFACLAAKRFGVRKTIAEIENIDYIQMAEGLDIGTVLNKKTIAASYIYQMMLDSSVRGMHNLTNADAEIVEFYAKEGSLVTKYTVKNLDLPTDANIGGIVRAGEGILVNGDTQIIAGDLVVLFCKNHILRKLERFFK